MKNIALPVKAKGPEVGVNGAVVWGGVILQMTRGSESHHREGT